MTNQEKIKEAYFKLFEEKSLIEKEKRFDAIKSFIDSYGWLSGSLFGVDKKLLDFSGHEERPKSLQGIENNNGWIKIESEDDLPKEDGLYWIIDGDNGLFLSEFKKDFMQFSTDDFAYNDYELTHYQPIEKPKPPLY